MREPASTRAMSLVTNIAINGGHGCGVRVGRRSDLASKEQLHGNPGHEQVIIYFDQDDAGYLEKILTVLGISCPPTGVYPISMD